MEYAEWNFAIASHFFNTNMGGKEVLLFVNEEKINDIGVSKKADVNDFINAIKEDAEHANNIICKRALKLYSDWERTRSEYPPYIGYLALFVLSLNYARRFRRKSLLSALLETDRYTWSGSS